MGRPSNPAGLASARIRRRAAAAALRLFASAALFAALLPAPAAAQGPGQEPAQEREQVLPGSGIRYPMGYDAETEGAVEGRVVDIEVPRHGPVVLRLEAGGRPVRVLAAPGWFWERGEWQPAPGDLLRVVGSKTVGADGELYVVAREIHPAAGCGCALRDEEGRPLWRGRMHRAPARRCVQPGPGPRTPGR